MFCNKCGNQMADGQKFCNKCGTPTGNIGMGGYNYVPTPTGSTSATKPYNMLTLISAILTIVGTFLPIYSVFGVNISYIQGDGLLVAFFTGISLILAAVKCGRFAFIPTLISALILFIDSYNVSSVSLGIGSFSVGFYVMWAGIIGTILFSILSLVNRKK